MPADTDLSKFVLKIREKYNFYVKTTADLLKEIISSPAFSDKKMYISDSQLGHLHMSVWVARAVILLFSEHFDVPHLLLDETQRTLSHTDLTTFGL